MALFAAFINFFFQVSGFFKSPGGIAVLMLTVASEMVLKMLVVLYLIKACGLYWVIRGSIGEVDGDFLDSQPWMIVYGTLHCIMILPLIIGIKLRNKVCLYTVANMALIAAFLNFIFHASGFFKSKGGIAAVIPTVAFELGMNMSITRLQINRKKQK
nr:hypothetical transcript [Hymenolepis microstoma]